MDCVSVQSGATEPLTVHLVDSGGAAVSGLTPTITIRREDSTSWWNGSAMVASGVELSMTEVDSGDATGDYRYNFATSGADSAKYIVELTPSSVSGVANLPAIGGVEVSLAALLSEYQGFIWIDALIASQGGIGTPGQVMGVNGLQSNPVDNITDARALADALGIRAYRIRGDITLDQAYMSWRFEGWATDQLRRGSLRLGGQRVNARIYELQLRGGLEADSATGGDASRLYVERCRLTAGHQHAIGTYVECQVAGTWDIMRGGDVEAIRCSRANESGSFWNVSSFFADSGSIWNIRDFSGDLQISELVSGNEVNIGMRQGRVLFGFNTLSGSVVLAGLGTTSGALSGATLDTTRFVDVKQIHRLNGENARTRLYFPTASIVSGVGGATRNVPKGSASHMRVEVKPEAATTWVTLIDEYWVWFNYGAAANAGDAPKSSITAAAAPTDGTFNTIPYPT